MGEFRVSRTSTITILPPRGSLNIARNLVPSFWGRSHCKLFSYSRCLTGDQIPVAYTVAMDGSLDPVRILDADSQDTLQDTLWDGAKLDLGHTSHLLEPPKALEPNVENGSKKRKFAPDLNASNDPPLKPASTIPSTVANSTIQTEDAVKRSEKRCKDMTETKSPRRFACPFRKHNPQRYSYPEWRHCALSAFESIARVKYAFLQLLPYESV